jgi:hypothetical protein
VNVHTYALTSHLHGNPLTLPALQRLVPALNLHATLLSRLATNIAFHHSKGRISQKELEDMLEHIFLNPVKRKVYADIETVKGGDDG